MFKLTDDEMGFIGLFLEAFLYGLYSGIFAMYLQHQASKKDTSKTQKIVFYSICSLYILSVAVFACDIVFLISSLRQLLNPTLRMLFIQHTLFACCDSIAQFILIYRCWIVWGHNIRVVIIPSILTFAFLVVYLVGSTYIFSDHLVATPAWTYPMILSDLSLPLAVNALVTGLIVFRIFRVFREVKGTSDDQILGATSGSTLLRIIFIIIESGMALFSIQLVRLVFSFVWTDTGVRGLDIIIGIHEMLIGITPTIIVLRTSMGLSFDEEKSMEEVAIESLRFASNHPNSVPETGSISIVGQDSRDHDDIDV